MGAVRFRDTETGRIVRGLVIVVAAVLMIVPAYINYELGIAGTTGPKIGFEPVVSMGITLELFAIAIVLFIVAVGPEKFKPKSQAQ
jgi:hypothetical protein